ncbi:MAG: DUF6602 domain-containing protein [Pirellulaceae bacterium]
MGDEDVIQKACGDALILRGHNLKASCYIRHPGELGFLREKMVSLFVRDNTPGKFEVLTGFIHDQMANLVSPQCDILICDNHEIVPLYRWDDLVVVQVAAAKAAIEIKTTVDSAALFEDIIRWHARIMGLGVFDVPTLVYSLKAMTFDSAVEQASKAIAANQLRRDDTRRARNVPAVFAANDRHYIMVRPHFSSGVQQSIEDVPDAVCCVDFSKSLRFRGTSELEGIETGCFTQFYKHALSNFLPPFMIYPWFDAIETEPGGKFWISASGDVRTDSPYLALMNRRIGGD